MKFTVAIEELTAPIVANCPKVQLLTASVSFSIAAAMAATVWYGVPSPPLRAEVVIICLGGVSVLSAVLGAKLIKHRVDGVVGVVASIGLMSFGAVALPLLFAVPCFIAGLIIIGSVDLLHRRQVLSF